MGPEFSSQLIMLKKSFRKVIIYRHEPGYIFRDLLVPPRNSIWALITRILCPRVGGASRFDGRIEGFGADWLPCSNRTDKSVFARHRDRTRHRSDMIAVCRGGQVGVQAASRW